MLLSHATGITSKASLLRAGFVPGNRFAVFGHARSSNMLESILEGQVNPHFSPLQTMKNLGAAFDLVPITSDGQKHSYENVSISACRNPHGHATCWRIASNSTDAPSSMPPTLAIRRVAPAMRPSICIAARIC